MEIILLTAITFVLAYIAVIQTLNFIQSRELAIHEFYDNPSEYPSVEIPDEQPDAVKQIMDIINKNTQNDTRVREQAEYDLGINETGVELIDELDEKLAEQRRRGY